MIPLKIDIRANTVDGQGTIFDATFSAVDMDGNASDPIVVVEDIAVVDGKFEIAFDMATLPAAYSPSFSDVVFSPVIAAEIQNEDFFCGTVTGRVDTFEQDLEASTFGAAPFASTDTPPTDCSGEGPPMFDRIEDCPALAAGRNTMFPSAGFERTFDLYLPNDADPAEPAPLVFLFHGLGGDADEFITRTEMDTYVDDLGFVLVVPTSMQGGVEWDQLTLDDNPDLTFFDDMVTCVTEQYNVDTDRIHATGLSAGGLFSSYLGLQRPAVLASVAPFSGGFLAGYPDPEPTIPYMVSWGGEMDLAFDQNFNELAMRMIGTLTENGHGLVTCNHNMEHVWEAEFTPWALRYLFDHPKGAAAPYAAALPDAFPDYCNFVQ